MTQPDSGSTCEHATRAENRWRYRLAGANLDLEQSDRDVFVVGVGRAGRVQASAEQVLGPQHASRQQLSAGVDHGEIVMDNVAASEELLPVEYWRPVGC
jgi:hypothetical protein